MQHMQQPGTLSQEMSSRWERRRQGQQGERNILFSQDTWSYEVPAPFPSGATAAPTTYPSSGVAPVNTGSSSSTATRSTRHVWFASSEQMPREASPQGDLNQPSDTCTINFSDGSQTIRFSPSNPSYFESSSGSNSSLATVIRGHMSFPVWRTPEREDETAAEQCYHSHVRIEGKEGLVIDTAAVHSIAGEHWFQRSSDLAKAHGQGSSLAPLQRSFNIEGVGKDSNEVTHHGIVPIAMANGESGPYSADILRDSPLPGLLGLEPMIKERTLLDLHSGMMMFVGDGGYELKLSPGSSAHKLLRAKSGHLILPTSEWDKVKKPGKSAVAFMTT